MFWSNPTLDFMGIPIQVLALQLAWLGFGIEWPSFSNSGRLRRKPWEEGWIGGGGRRRGGAAVALPTERWRKVVGQGTGGESR